MLKLEDNCHLQELFWKTTVTVNVNFRDSYVRNGRLLSFTKNSFGRPLSLSSYSFLELEDYCHLQEFFWKTTVTVLVNFRDSYVRIRRLLSLKRTLLEDHCHCHHCHC